jgi:hypothetical protein
VTTILDMAASATRPGVEPPTPRWAAVLAYFYGLELTPDQVAEVAAASGRSPESIVAHCAEVTGKRRFRQLWVRAGRRARKSSTAAMVAVYEALYGGHERFVMPGETALAAVISKDLAASMVVTKFVRLYLDALGIKYSTSKLGAVNLIEIEGCSVAIATLAAASEAPRSHAIACLILDEWAHVSSDEAHVDTDKSILAGAEPAMAQFADSVVIGISSGLGRSGVHYERVQRGLGNDSEREILSVTGASWDFSKDITPERALAIADGDDETMTTEFFGGVSENEGLWMPQANAAAMFEPKPGHYLRGAPFMICDFAESGDTLAFCIGAWCEPDTRQHFKRKPSPPGFGPDVFVGWELDEYGRQIAEPIPDRPILKIWLVDGIKGADVKAMGMARAVDRLAKVARQHGVKQIIGDDRGGAYVEALFSAYQGLRFNFVNYANRKHESALLCRGWARDRQIESVRHAEFEKQCLRYRRYVSGASYKYGKPGQADDFVCLLITLACSMIVQANEQRRLDPKIDKSPTRRIGRERYEQPYTETFY